MIQSLSDVTQQLAINNIEWCAARQTSKGKKSVHLECKWDTSALMLPWQVGSCIYKPGVQRRGLHWDCRIWRPWQITGIWAMRMDETTTQVQLERRQPMTRSGPHGIKVLLRREINRFWKAAAPEVWCPGWQMAKTYQEWSPAHSYWRWNKRTLSVSPRDYFSPWLPPSEINCTGICNTCFRLKLILPFSVIVHSCFNVI